jgi:hypothetical protein
MECRRIQSDSKSQSSAEWQVPVLSASCLLNAVYAAFKNQEGAQRGFVGDVFINQQAE